MAPVKGAKTMQHAPVFRNLLMIATLCALPLPVTAQTYSEAAKGSPTRQDILDAIRPHAEWNFAPPVEFVVGQARVADDVAFVTLRAQRPGGAEIDIFSTPIVQRTELDPYAGDGPTMEVLLQKSGRVWVAVHFGISSSEGWWYAPEYCPIWSAVIPEACP